MNRADFKRYLRETLIPDLREGGRDCAADDFEEALRHIERLEKRVEGPASKKWVKLFSQSQRLLGRAIQEVERSANGRAQPFPWWLAWAEAARPFAILPPRYKPEPKCRCGHLMRIHGDTPCGCSACDCSEARLAE